MTTHMDSLKVQRQWFEPEASPEVLASHAEQVTYWRTNYPAMFDAPQPAVLPRESGSFSLQPKEEFARISAQIAAGQYFLRDPAPLAYQSLICSHCIGSCLSPLIDDGVRIYTDPTAVPMHGDVVTVLMRPDTLQYFANLNSENDEWAQTYGCTPSPVMVKLLWKLGAEWYLMTNTGCLPLEAAERVCGVVRRIERGYERLYEPLPVHCAAVPASSIDTASRSSDTFTGGLWSSSSDPESTGVNVTGQTGIALQATVTAQVNVTTFAAAQDLNCKFFWDSALNKVSGSQDNYYPITRAGKFTITVSATFSSSSGIDGSIGAIFSVFDAPASVGNTIVVTEHNLRITSLRR